MFCTTSVICHANWKRVIETIGCQLIFARTLMTKELAIECLVVWIAKDCANARTFNALGTALAFGCDDFLIWATLELLTLHPYAANLAVTALTWAASLTIPDLVILARDKKLIDEKNPLDWQSLIIKTYLICDAFVCADRRHQFRRHLLTKRTTFTRSSDLILG